MYDSFYIHSPVGRHLCCFSVFATISSMAVNIRVQVSFQIRVFPDTCPGEGVLDPHDISSLFLEGPV